ncbi:hypothetical protein P154DRAFT_581812 [Amniculicola lignicola CBS 123094]|uniref:Uncharacterized protein n=1 Tax=Amniculicola lignicola CBS 123094 TaxID=1392246 RepID=A0A6A5W9Y2_9PLEO|nr:hypothetical protein P154DRAFT_581812 [Amniculicola lignicola CBS 123094]
MGSPTSSFATHPRQPVPVFFFESSPPTLEATSHSPWFKLPLEVRDRIYDCLWSGVELQDSNEACAFTLVYPGFGNDRGEDERDEDERNEDETRIPTWPLTSKLLLAEAFH